MAKWSRGSRGHDSELTDLAPCSGETAAVPEGSGRPQRVAHRSEGFQPEVAPRLGLANLVPGTPPRQPRCSVHAGMDQAVEYTRHDGGPEGADARKPQHWTM